MNERHSEEAIILKRWDFGEKDQIVSFFSCDRGRHQGIAKGAKSSRHRFVGALDLFCLSRLNYKEKKTSSLVMIEEARLIHGFPKIRDDYNNILLASAFLEMGYRLYKEGEGEKRGFFILKSALERLESEAAQREFFWSTLLENLEVVGLAPHLHECIRCGKDARLPFLGFDLWGGGMVCSRCSSPSSQWIEIPESLERWLTQSEEPSSTPIHLKREDEKILDRLLRQHLKIQMDIDLEWSRFLDFF